MVEAMRGSLSLGVDTNRLAIEPSSTLLDYIPSTPVSQVSKKNERWLEELRMLIDVGDKLQTFGTESKYRARNVNPRKTASGPRPLQLVARGDRDEEVCRKFNRAMN
jgi:hypothetical protein